MHMQVMEHSYIKKEYSQTENHKMSKCHAFRKVVIKGCD